MSSLQIFLRFQTTGTTVWHSPLASPLTTDYEQAPDALQLELIYLQLLEFDGHI